MQDLDKFKNEMNLSGQNVYVGHRYVPKIMGDWDNTQIYEPLSIVQYQGNSFTSRQYVPSGIELNNEEYWVSTGNYNAQIEQYRQDVVNLGNDVNNFNGEVITARNGEENLKARLDKDKKEVNEKFAQNEQLLNDLITINLNSYKDYANNVGTVDEDWSDALAKAEQTLIANGGGRLLVPRVYPITKTIHFSGVIQSTSTYPYKNKITIDGNKIGGFIYKGIGSGEDFIRLSRENEKLEYRIIFKDLMINANYKNVVSVNGFSHLTPNNTLCEMHNVDILNFNGEGSYGINGGNMTDCRLFNVHIQGGDNQGIGIKVRRSNVKLYECTINYCKHGVVLPSFSEGNMQFIGGSIAVCDSLIHIEANSNNANTSYFFGTFLGENYEYAKIITTELEDSTDVGSLTFIGCEFYSLNTTEPLIDLSFGGRVTIQGCNAYFGTKIKKVRKGGYCELIMFGNSTIEYDREASAQSQNINRFFRENGGDVNAEGGFKQLINFYKKDVSAGINSSTLERNNSLVKGYVMNYDGSVLACALQTSEPIQQGWVQVDIYCNETNTYYSSKIDFSSSENKQLAIKTFNKDSEPGKFSKGDVLYIKFSSSQDLTPTPLDITVDLTIEN